ncbi:flagellar type III secretion system pore protein FliP [Jatrophihabitans cynanchi]|uniref:Flagellar biosynthetic protein FliP n=1 Tax=Jatrophihabitans cynanchi TaxID=2944128 RepID=A0ABY7JSW2_9ACTN|nr:flagellar type III secretion system pore protein FliP [Jatrophihabitans sp. SB3-54]WAX55429.1 flagellar type III secretion system pore protein FliP [Jatrophihabitans sp. SB3-54]
MATRVGLLLLTLLGAVWFFGLNGTQRADAAPVSAAPAAAAVTLGSARQALTAPAALSAPAALAPTAPAAPTAPKAPTAPDPGTVTVNVGGKPSQSISILMLVTVLSVAPSLLLLVTSFTKIFIVLSLTRNALGLQSVPPNQVLAGLSLFLSLFVMGPVLTKVNKLGIQPYLNGTKSRSVAWTDGIAPLREFMLAHTRPQEIALMLRAGNLPNPPDKSKLELTTIIPAFVLSELRAAMIIGFVVYVPFVIIDLVVSSSLMSLGMMMLPPVSVSLPFKLLLFVLVDGWGLIITALVQSYHTG